MDQLRSATSVAIWKFASFCSPLWSELSKSKQHQQTYDFWCGLDLKFLRRGCRKNGRNFQIHHTSLSSHAGATPTSRHDRGVHQGRGVRTTVTVHGASA